MSIFDKFRKQKKVSDNNQNIQITNANDGFKVHAVDGILKIELPEYWESFESDRFRAKSSDGKTQISITNFGMDIKQSLGETLLKNITLPLYERFVAEGGFEPHDDLIVNDRFISKSFKVDEETQYYLTAINMIGGKVIQTAIIVRDIGEYNLELRKILLSIAETIQF